MTLEKPAAEPIPTAQVTGDEDDEEAKAGVDIWKYILGFTEMAVVKCAIDLGIADAIESHPDPSISLSQLASKLGCYPSSLHRILRFLVHRKIFRHHADTDTYSQTPLSRLLLTKGEKSMAALILLETTPVMLAPWLNLSSHVSAVAATAPPPFMVAHGDDLWVYSAANPGHSRLIDEAMACDARVVVPTVAEDCPEVFEGVLTMVDVGGGNGTTLKLLRKAFPWIRGINFDLPHVVSGALPPCEGVEHARGDMFEGVPKADAAFLKVHAASLIHDDLPCMDDDPSRRGQPSNHTVYGVDMAILAGDALFPLGFRHIVSQTPSDLVPEPRLLRVIAEIARSVGSTGMAAGQFLDLEGGPNSVDFVQEKKFGEMAECSAVCGGLLGGAEDEEIRRLRRYGRAVGVLYQVVEDILEEQTKSGMSDEEKKKKKGKSYVRLYGIEKALEVAKELKDKAKKELETFEKYGDRVAPLYSFVDYAAEREFTFGSSS